MLSSELIIKVNGIKTRKDASKIRKALNSVDGVKSTKVSLKRKRSGL